MKKTCSDNTILKNLFFVVIAAMMIFSTTSCARKISFTSSSVVPAARGDVKIKKDDNKNYSIQIHVTNLAEVERLQPARHAYVVWMDTDQQTTKNIGQIKSSSGMLSGKLKASFETVSSFKPVRIFITAEDDADISYPGSQLVLTTERF